MEVTGLQWLVTILIIAGLLAFDFVFHVRKAHEPTVKEAAIWSAIYISIAVLFGLYIFVTNGPSAATEFYAGYITEEALSVDNLFVFMIIMGTFRVARENQQKVLLFGIIFAIFARGVFIFAGAAIINSFAWVFYIFGLVLLMTAGNLLKDELTEGDDEADNIMVRLAKKYLKTSDHFDGDKLFTLENGKRVMTPMMLVMVAIAGSDLLFALDSIPAIFGLTQSVYIVFVATAFSLMGLRQLYFLIDGLLDRLVYLSYGLATILAFIGVKLILHAMHENNLPFINHGESVHVVEITTEMSLLVIVGVLVITVLASLLSPKGRALQTIQRVQALSEKYLALPEDAPAAERADITARWQQETKKLKTIPQKLRDELIEKEDEYHALVMRARTAQDAHASSK